MELRPFKTRRERELDARISEIANAAVLAALEMSGESTPPFRVKIPPQPKRLKAKPYLERVQENVATTLGVLGCERVIECDDYMTSLVNAGVVTERASTNVFTRHHRNDLPLLVFREPAFAGELQAFFN